MYFFFTSCLIHLTKQDNAKLCHIPLYMLGPTHISFYPSPLPNHLVFIASNTQ